jgi:hypothetical protein
MEGPGPVSFGDTGAAEATAEFAATGDYLLRLVGDDGELWRSDLVAVHVLPAGVSVAAAWEFNTPLDKEGWTEVNPGTRTQDWQGQRWPTRSEPVKHVGGGYFVLAIENSPDACLISPDELGIDLGRNPTVRLRLQNHTPASRMRIRFITNTDTSWDDTKSRSFDVVPNDTGPRGYAVDMSSVSGWTGRLKQFRVDLATGTTLTGTCRFDYVWIDSSKAVAPGGGPGPRR